MKPSNLLFPNLVSKFEERTGAFLTELAEPPCFPQQTKATKSNQDLPIPSRPWGQSSVPMASPHHLRHLRAWSERARTGTIPRGHP